MISGISIVVVNGADTGKISQHLISVGNLQFASICDLDTTSLIFEYSSAPPLKIINIHSHHISFNLKFTF